mmetsp:Transcript_3802/g.9099  ORF Transcript_3802/g.9099 Transcript_3802/m.9099 type:complete len:200 (-) Transcript_3802:420-1019(-)
MDTRPDLDNLAYGGLYRLDVAKLYRFREGDTGDLVSEGMTYTRQQPVYAISSLTPRADGYASVTWGKTATAGEGKRGTGAEGRYFSSLALMRERNRRVRRLNLASGCSWQHRVSSHASSERSEPLGDFVLLNGAAHTIHPVNQSRSQTTARHRDEDPVFKEDAEGESTDEYLTRRTREFNENIRAQPHNLGLWPHFAEF